MKKRYVAKKTRLVRLGSVSCLTKGGGDRPVEITGQPQI